jgi:hypothetical protein
MLIAQEFIIGGLQKKSENIQMEDPNIKLLDLLLWFDGVTPIYSCGLFVCHSYILRGLPFLGPTYER